ncbi:MAG: IS5 family transposase [Candidatus Improbicoccus devescovinae]|nr:MAG: IS5 family transposase [Candidatus Improbicoccus devescovinae]
MNNLQNRHDLKNEQWLKIEPIIKKLIGTWGGSNAKDNQTFVNACFWITRTGAPCRDLPPQYGKFNAVHRRYKRWCDRGIWDSILAELIDDPDFEWLMIDASHIKIHPHAAGAKGGNQDMERTKGGSIPKFTWLWMRMVRYHRHRRG